MELAVLNSQGQETGRKVVLSDAVFGVEANDHAIYLDVKQYLADQRQGTHKAKQRNEVAGSTRKLKRQKGTGGARCGSIKSPLFPGGGRVFGPVPRDYSFKLNKKLKRLARRSALTYKAQAGAINVVVTDVNTIRCMGKLKSRYTKAGLLEGRTNNFKKAIVTLKDGDKIDFYSNI